MLCNQLQQVEHCHEAITREVGGAVEGAPKLAEQDQQVLDFDCSIVVEVAGAIRVGAILARIPAVSGFGVGQGAGLEVESIIEPFVARLKVARRALGRRGDESAPAGDCELVFMIAQRKIQRHSPHPVRLHHRLAIPTPIVEATIEVDGFPRLEVERSGIYAERDCRGFDEAGRLGEVELELAVGHLDVRRPKSAQRTDVAALVDVPTRQVEPVEVVFPFEGEIVARSSRPFAGRVGVVADIFIMRSAGHGRGIEEPRPGFGVGHPQIHEDPHRVNEGGDQRVAEEMHRLVVDEPADGARGPFNGVIDHFGVGIECGGDDLGLARVEGMVGGELD